MTKTFQVISGKIFSYFILSTLFLILGFSRVTKAAVSIDPADYIVSTIQQGVNGVDKLNSLGDIFVQGDYLYEVGNEDDSFTIFDISDPENPVQESILTTTSPNNYLQDSHNLYVQGDYAYVLSYTSSDDDGLSDSRFNIIDVSDPENPVIESSTHIGRIDEKVSYSDIKVQGNYAYVTETKDHKLLIFDISNPASPTLITTIQNGVNGFNLLGDPNDIFISGNYLYVSAAHNYSTVNIIDISTLTAPVLKSTIQFSAGELEDIYVKDNTLYVLNWNDISGNETFLRSYDVSNPASPTLIHTFNRRDFGLIYNLIFAEIAVKDDLIYITKGGIGVGHGSLLIINIKDANNPFLVADLDYYSGWTVLDAALRVTFNDNNVFVATNTTTPKIVILGNKTTLEKPKVYDANLFPTKVNSTYDADFAHIGDSTTLTGNVMIPVDSSKTYKIKGEFRGKDNTTQSRVYFGFAEYDKRFGYISPQRVHRVSPTTDAATFSSISSDRLTLTMNSTVPSSWCSSSSDTYNDGVTRSCSNEQDRTLAIYLDGDMSKLPDFTYTYSTTSSDTITLTSALPEIVVGTLNSNTKFLQHARTSTYNYSGANYELVGADWTSFEGNLVTGEVMEGSDFTHFRKGVKYIKPVILANFGQTGLGTELYMRNISVVEVDAYGNETPVNIPLITNQNIKPKFVCEDNAFLVMTSGTNLSTVSAEGTYTVSGYCQNPITAEKETRSITFEIDKTAPSAPTWDAISSGTYSTGQNVFVTPSSNSTVVFYGGANSQTISYFPFIDGVTLTSNGSTNRTYQIYYRQYDAAGNLSSSATSTRSYTITP